MSDAEALRHMRGNTVSDQAWRRRGCMMEQTRDHGRSSAQLGCVTVIIPTHNRQALLEEALESVRRQTSENWRLVVVDDASDDSTWSWLQQQIGQQIRAIRLDEQTERSAARNRGLAECVTEFVLFLDDDDRLLPTAVEHLTSALVRDRDAVAVAGAFEYFDDAGHTRRGPHPRRRFKRWVWPDAVFGWVVHTGRTLVRADAAREAGGFAGDLSLGEDRDLWLRLSRIGPMAFIPDTVLGRRMHDGQRRPPDVQCAEQEITRRRLVGLETTERRLGERILQARNLTDTAIAALRSRRVRDASRALFGLRRAPSLLLFSPLVRPMWVSPLWRAVVESILGKRGTNLALRVKTLVLAAVGKENWDVPFPAEGEDRA